MALLSYPRLTPTNSGPRNWMPHFPWPVTRMTIVLDFRSQRPLSRNYYFVFDKLVKLSPELLIP